MKKSRTPGNFTVAGGDAARTVSNVAVSGRVVTLALDPAVEHGETGITVSYTVPTGTGATPIQDIVGNDAGALTDQEVENKTASADTFAPLFLSAGMSSEGSTIALTFDERLDGGNGPASGDFAVMVEGAPRAVSTAAVVGRSVELSLASPVTEGQTVRVSYTDPTAGVDDSNAIQDTDGNDTTSLTAQVPSRAVWSVLMTVGGQRGLSGVWRGCRTVNRLDHRRGLQLAGHGLRGDGYSLQFGHQEHQHRFFRRARGD